MSNRRESESKNVSTFRLARLQAVSSRNMYSEQLWTVMPAAMNEFVVCSVRSKTGRRPISVRLDTRSKLPASSERAMAKVTAWASCSSLRPGNRPMYLAKDRRLPESIRRPWRLESASREIVESQVPSLTSGIPPSVIPLPFRGGADCRSGKPPKLTKSELLLVSCQLLVVSEHG